MLYSSVRQLQAIKPDETCRQGLVDVSGSLHLDAIRITASPSLSPGRTSLSDQLYRHNEDTYWLCSQP